MIWFNFSKPNKGLCLVMSEKNFDAIQLNLAAKMFVSTFLRNQFKTFCPFVILPILSWTLKKPISAHRFWGLQIILTSIPLVVYSIISQHMNEKLSKCWLMKRFKKKRERKKRKNRRILRWIYGFCSIARLAIGRDFLEKRVRPTPIYNKWIFRNDSAMYPHGELFELGEYICLWRVLGLQKCCWLLWKDNHFDHYYNLVKIGIKMQHMICFLLS